MRTPRRVAHFEDPRLERQFEEILKYEEERDEEIEEIRREIEPDRPPPEPGPSPPSKPQNLAVASAFKKHIISWDRLGGQDVAGYVINYSVSYDDQNAWEPWQIIDVGPSSFYIHDGLVLTSDYRYRVASYDEDNIRSEWTDIVVAGKPGKVSLSEEVIGDLHADFLENGTISEDKFDDPVSKQFGEIDDNKAYITALEFTATEISQTVSEIYDDGTGIMSTIHHEADTISLRIVELDNGTKTVINEISLGVMDTGDEETANYIQLSGDQIFLDGDTNVSGDFEVKGTLVGVDGTFTGTLTALGEVLIDTIGENAIASGIDAMAIGNEAEASGDDSVSVGRYSVALENESIALGEDARASGAAGVSVGTLSRATEPDTVAVGTGARATAGEGIAIGRNTHADRQRSVALGTNVTVSGYYSAALVNSSWITEDYLIKIGMYEHTTDIPGNLTVGREFGDVMVEGTVTLTDEIKTVTIKSISTGHMSYILDAYEDTGETSVALGAPDRNGNFIQVWIERREDDYPYDDADLLYIRNSSGTEYTVNYKVWAI